MDQWLNWKANTEILSLLRERKKAKEAAGAYGVLTATDQPSTSTEAADGNRLAAKTKPAEDRIRRADNVEAAMDRQQHVELVPKNVWELDEDLERLPWTASNAFPHWISAEMLRDMANFGRWLGEQEVGNLVKAETVNIEGVAKGEGHAGKSLVKIEDQGEERGSLVKFQQLEAHGSRKRRKLASTETLEHWRGLLGLIALSCQTKIVSSSDSVAKALRKLYDVEETTYGDPLEICRDFIDAYGNQSLHVIRLSLHDEDPSDLASLASLDVSHVSAQNDSRIRPLAGLVFDRDRSFDAKAPADVLLSLVQDPARRLLLVLEKRGKVEVMVAVPWDEHDFVSRSNSFAAFLDEEALSRPMPPSIGFNASLIACFNYVPVSGREEFYLKLFRMEGCVIASLTGFALQLLADFADEVKAAFVDGRGLRRRRPYGDVGAQPEPSKAPQAASTGDNKLMPQELQRQVEYAMAVIWWVAENDRSAPPPLESFADDIQLGTCFRSILRRLDLRQIHQLVPDLERIDKLRRPQAPGQDVYEKKAWTRSTLREVYEWYQILSIDQDPAPNLIDGAIQKLDQFLDECQALPDEVAVDMLFLRASLEKTQDGNSDEAAHVKRNSWMYLSGVIVEELTEDKALACINLLRHRTSMVQQPFEVSEKARLFSLLDDTLTYVVDREDQIRCKYFLGCGGGVGMFGGSQEADGATDSSDDALAKANMEEPSDEQVKDFVTQLVRGNRVDFFINTLNKELDGLPFRQATEDEAKKTVKGGSKKRTQRRGSRNELLRVSEQELNLWKNPKFVEMWGKCMLLCLLREVIDVKGNEANAERGGCGFESLARSAEYYDEYYKQKGIGHKHKSFEGMAIGCQGRGTDSTQYERMGRKLVREALEAASKASEVLPSELEADFEAASEQLNSYEDEGTSTQRVCTESMLKAVAWYWQEPLYVLVCCSIRDPDGQAEKVSAEGPPTENTASQRGPLQSLPEGGVPVVEVYDPRYTSFHKTWRLGREDGLRRVLRDREAMVFIKTGKSEEAVHHLRPCLPFSIRPDAGDREGELKCLREDLDFAVRNGMQLWRLNTNAEDRKLAVFKSLYISIYSDRPTGARKLTFLAGLIFMHFTKRHGLAFLRDAVCTEANFPPEDFRKDFPKQIKTWLYKQLSELQSCFPYREKDWTCPSAGGGGSPNKNDANAKQLTLEKVKSLKGFLCAGQLFSHGVEARTEAVIDWVKDFDYEPEVPRSAGGSAYKEGILHFGPSAAPEKASTAARSLPLTSSVGQESFVQIQSV
uniref:Uncharacterized protein n=1 Tax=Pinguiococcus pyrenoidosus TaxID=172671 RepID=A0A7R9YC63_9STRA